MRRTSSTFRLHLAYLLIAFVAMLNCNALAGTEKVLYSFDPDHDDGYFPQAALIFDSAGNLYSTTAKGGGSRACLPGGCGTVFELSLNAEGSWSENVLHQFQLTDGQFPVAPVRFDSRGNLYGTAWVGGSGNLGTLFQMSPAGNGTWNTRVLHQFTGGWDGGEPGAVILDSAGRIYGTTLYGGAPGEGVAFSLHAQGTVPIEVVLHNFVGNTDGENPSSPLLLDANGNLYGVAEDGANGSGIVYKLTPNRQSFGWAETLLHTFTGRDGASPTGGLIFDAHGNLYGETFAGGQHAEGTVFELSPNGDGSWTETVLHDFSGGGDGQNPVGGLTMDQSGNLYGTTNLGGTSGAGTVFKLTPASAGIWAETVLYSFTGGADGGEPFGGVVLDGAGNLYGTASMGGLRPYGQAGVVFEITP